jgi:hypothetical protein
MLGAHRRLASAVYFGVGAVLFFMEHGRAVELGNILFPPEQDASRKASAMALHAISDAIRAFEQRELNEPQASQALFAQSRETLRMAAKNMFNILSGAKSSSDFGRYLDTEVSLDGKLSKEDFYFYNEWAKEAGATEIRTRRQAFQVFATQTVRLADSLDPSSNDQDFFRKATDQIGRYLKGGDITTRLLR